MAQFLGDIAGMMEIFAVALVLVLLHRAAGQPKAMLLKVAGAVLVVGGIGVGLCTTWYWLEYRADGAFEHATVAPMSHGASQRAE